jgi:streptogramin lyase
MNRVAVVIGAVVVGAGVVAAASAAGRIPGARGVPACAATGPYWPTMTLALGGGAAWVACKEQQRIVRVTLTEGRRTAARRLDAPVTAVALGYGSLWALDSASTLYRLDARTARVEKKIELGANAAYNIWTGAGAVWVADDQGASVIRISPATNKVVARVGVGDGPADMVFAGTRAWVLTHRDNTLYRIDTRANTARRLAPVAGGNAAAERIALLDGRLWITGRGVGLLDVDPDTGATRRSIDIGGTGIDVVAAAGSLWIPVRTAAVDRTGFPTMTAVPRVTAAGKSPRR